MILVKLYIDFIKKSIFRKFWKNNYKGFLKVLMQNNSRGETVKKDTLY